MQRNATPRRGRFAAALLPVYVAAGVFKGSPVLAWLPVDLTLACAVVLVLAISNTLVGAAVRRERPAVGWVVAALAAMIVGAVRAPESDYAQEKILEMVTLTLVAVAGGVLLVRTDEQRRWLVFGTIGTGVAVAALYLVAPTTDDALLGRAALEGSNTIGLGRYTGAALVGVVVLALTRRLAFAPAVAIGVPLLWVLIGTGSRGPIVATAVALAVTMLPLAARAGHRSRSLALGGLVVVGGWWFLGRTVEAARNGVLLLVADDKGVSVNERERIWSAGWAVFERSPLGVGGGGLAPSITPNRYPHNIVVEVAAEGGLPVLMGLLVLLVVAYRRAYRMARLGDPMLIGLLTFWLANAMVSEDVNGNRAVLILAGACVALTRSGSEQPHLVRVEVVDQGLDPLSELGRCDRRGVEGGPGRGARRLRPAGRAHHGSRIPESQLLSRARPDLGARRRSEPDIP